MVHPPACAGAERRHLSRGARPRPRPERKICPRACQCDAPRLLSHPQTSSNIGLCALAPCWPACWCLRAYAISLPLPGLPGTRTHYL